MFCPLCHNELDGGEDIIYGESVCKTCYEKHRLEESWANKYRRQSEKANKKTKRKTNKKELQRRLRTRVQEKQGRRLPKRANSTVNDRRRFPRD